MPKARLIDVSKCIACRACQVACKQWNELEAVTTRQRGTYENPPRLSAHTWIKVEFRERPNEWLFRAHTCMHCTNAGCEQVCPTGAISHQGEVVVIDQNWCVGCGYCVQACPFHVPDKDEIAGTARKCTFCIDRITNGLTPACAKTCPTGAIQFGERADMIAAAHDRVQTLVARDGYRGARVYGEHEMGGLHTIYVLTDAPEVFGLPEEPRLATATVGTQWLSGAITAGVIAILPFWLLFQRRNRIAAERESNQREV
ncbi:MAG: 4Fe-4S dicluster domain-containing protein [Dehalococcoidia bacterium]|jgi:formate dehydrogenase iron-sulfur subunit|nr:MAG: 4Fe-4S dicluster domain-containing protein [Dehalococcoidia bacterium]